MSTRLNPIHHKLIFRLIVACTLLFTLLGTVTFQYARRQLQEQVIEMVQVGVDVLRSEFQGRIGTPSDAGSKRPLRQFMDNLARNPPVTDLGRFAYLVVYDTTRREVARATRSSEAEIRQFTEILAPLQPGRTSPRVESGSLVRVGNERGMPFALAIADDRGQIVGYVKGIFMLSRQTETRLLRATWGASGLAVIFVFVTALIIYPIVRGLIVKLEKQTMQLTYANIDIIKVLGSAIAKRDSDTDAHNYRVTLYAVRLAETVGLDERRIGSLMKGAFLHDVGKIAVRDAILLKPGRLSTEEFTEMKSHVQHGLEIVENASWLADAREVVGCHHEKYDGSGYPNQLAGEAIPIAARVFAVADVFDALTSVRPYKQALASDQALAIMREGAGRHFDPALIEAFASIAPDLHAAFNQDEDAPRQILDQVARRYIKNMLREEIDHVVEV